MRYEIVCDGDSTAVFTNEEKAMKYVAYALTQDGYQSVTVNAVDENGQPVQQTQEQPAAVTAQEANPAAQQPAVTL